MAAAAEEVEKEVETSQPEDKAVEEAKGKEATVTDELETVLDKGKEEAKPETSPTWPQDWREKLAGDNEKFLKQLQRFQDPSALGKSYLAAQQRISSGELKKVLPENPTEEQIAEYRKENGIPEKAADYLKDLPDGLVLGESDTPIVEDFAERMLQLNAPKEVVHEAAKWYNDFREQQIDARHEQDNTQREETEETLRAEWGNEFKPTLNNVQALLSSTFDEETASAFLNARAPDGTALLNMPGVMKGLAQIAREMNPMISLPGGTGDVKQSIDDRIADIEKMMREDRKAYNKDQKVQEEYRNLLDQREKLKDRGA